MTWLSPSVFCSYNGVIYNEQESIFTVLGVGKSKAWGRASGKGFLAVSSPQWRMSQERKSMCRTWLRERKLSQELIYSQGNCSSLFTRAERSWLKYLSEGHLSLLWTGNYVSSTKLSGDIQTMSWSRAKEYRLPLECGKGKGSPRKSPCRAIRRFLPSRIQDHNVLFQATV